ncbi:MAG: metal ABC transporter permease [Pyrobaculum sp.]
MAVASAGKMPRRRLGLGVFHLVALALTVVALWYAHEYTPLLFWPFVSLLSSSVVLALHSPMALGRRMTFLAHAQVHTVLTAALAAALSAGALSLGIGSAYYTALALLFVVLLNLAVLATERLGFAKDVATGLVMSFQMTATIALLYLVRTLYAATVDPVALITGEYVLITPRAVAVQAPFLAAASAFPIFFGLRYLYISLDEQFAESIGMRSRAYDYAFLMSMSVAVSASVFALGSLMPAVLLVLPGAIAARLSHKLSDQIPLSVSAAALSASASHFLYTLVPWLWPSAALGLVMFTLLLLRNK